MHSEPNQPDVPPNLGGHYNYTNRDTIAFDYLANRFNVKSMLDVGCGPGGMVDYALSHGIAASGIDGDPHMASLNVTNHDFTTGPHGWVPVDLIWCVEFVEHVEERYFCNFAETFRAGRILFLTHAQPEQPGYHHVNCQTDDYWIEMLRGDWLIDYEATGWIRVHSHGQYTKPNALVFEKVE
jgi:cyclopropane fatty-acyl-phospholipid synthase-like methyltransferase